MDSPINTTIPAGYLSIRAKSTGLVVVDSTGTETSIGSGEVEAHSLVYL